MFYTAPQISIEDEAKELAETSMQERMQIYKDKYGRDHPLSEQFQQQLTIDDNSIAANVSSAANDATMIERDDSTQETTSTENEENDNDDDDADNNNQEEHGEEEVENVPVDDADDEDADVSIEIIDIFHDELERIPLASKADFVSALIKAPLIVETESNPLVFIRYKDYEPRQAAMCLCEYWKSRVDIFGEVDAFKPMTLNGACKSIVKDIVKLPTMYRMLPNDDSGRKVFCFDRTNVNYSDFDDHMVFIKLYWFFYHRELQDISIQKNGAVVIFISQSSKINFMKRSAMKYCFNTCLPVKPCCVHFCASSLVSRIILPITKSFMKRETRQRTELHSSLATYTVLKELKEFGLQRENLPPSIGGTYNETPSWIAECKQIINNDKRANRWQ